VSPVGWCLHNILLSWCSTEEIGVSSRLVPIYIYKDKFLWFSTARVSTLNFEHYDLSLYVLAND
jgi:hypothetical protein